LFPYKELDSTGFVARRFGIFCTNSAFPASKPCPV
jgi:hypothetical protein